MPASALRWRVPDEDRRRLEVAAAMAWEALVTAHANEALRLVALLERRIETRNAVDRYLRGMAVHQGMAGAIRNRVLVAIDRAERGDNGPEPPAGPIPDSPADGAGSLLRGMRPDRLFGRIRDRLRRGEELQTWIRLAIARAEEALLHTHVENAITYAALLHRHMPLDRAVEWYIDSMSIAGGRAQAILQRAMARLADLYLPREGEERFRRLSIAQMPSSSPRPNPD